jgi:uncharacterized protein YndB with AHSA1/START domain
VSSVVVARIEIDAPPQAVWDFALDPAHTTEWVTIARDVGAVDDGPLRRGFRMDQTLVLRGLAFTVRWRLEDVDAPWFARWEGRGPAGARAVIEDRLSEREGGGTHFHYRNEFHTPFGPLGAVGGSVLMGGFPEREANASLQRLKVKLEAR